MNWIVTTDRSGRRAYCLSTGQVVAADGCGRMKATVYYARDRYGNQDYGMTETVAEAKAWGEIDATQRKAA